MIPRKIQNEINELLEIFPAVGIIGPRQSGKTTLAKQIIAQLEKECIYLDLESHADLAKISEPELFFLNNQDKCIVIDEIQHKPELFPLLRSVIDKHRVPARFIILGSASPKIMRDSSESLAGRIAYKELNAFNLFEIINDRKLVQKHWFRGGFPESLLARSDNISNKWIDNFITTYIERDLPQLGFGLSSIVIRKLWSMLASNHGNLFNASTLSKALDISAPTVKKYVEFLEEAFLVYSLKPFYYNSNKRLVKSPKIYIRDTGILHFLNFIYDFSQLENNILIGASWEGYVIEQIRQLANQNTELFFYRTHHGTECDLVLVKGIKPVAAIEIKYSSAPKISKGFTLSIQDLKTSDNFIITPQSDDYILRENIRVVNLEDFIQKYLPKI